MLPVDARLRAAASDTLHACSILSIVAEATQEAALEEMLRGVEAKWGVMEFEIRRHKSQKDTYLLDGFDDVIALLEESNVCLMTAASSRCASPDLALLGQM